MCVSKVQHMTGQKTGCNRSRPVFFWFFDFSTNLATGNQKIIEFLQLHLVVRSFPVGFSSISVFFAVEQTGPVNTIHRCSCMVVLGHHCCSHVVVLDPCHHSCVLALGAHRHSCVWWCWALISWHRWCHVVILGWPLVLCCSLGSEGWGGKRGGGSKSGERVEEGAGHHYCSHVLGSHCHSHMPGPFH